MRIRLLSRTTQYLLDISVFSIAFFLAYILRFDGLPEGIYLKKMVFQAPYVIALQFFVFLAAGNYRYSWRYVSFKELQRFFITCAIPVFPFLALRFTDLHLYLNIPISIITIDFLLAFLGTSGMRYLRRMVYEARRSNGGAHKPERERVLLIGAGSAGVMVAREFTSNSSTPFQAVAFVDDDPHKQKSIIAGLKVQGTINEIGEIAAGFSVKTAIITIADISSEQIKRIVNVCERKGLRVKMVPPLTEFFRDKGSILKIRDVAFDDLLGREKVTLDQQAIIKFIGGRRLLVTGAGGSIGSEICRQVCRYNPAALILVERAENALFVIHRELTGSFPELKILPCVADVADESRINRIFADFQPEIVFHAAAHKHVPLMEFNSGEAVKNNVLGTKTVAGAAENHGAAAFVMISTDKAVQPRSIMGATKRLAELYIKSISAKSKTAFLTVRFGNVLGSAGSAFIIFKQQIEAGGPVTITHPEMTRYFMTISEASLLVLQAATMGTGGEIFILDMGKPVKILDMVKEYIQLSGLTLDEDIQIVFTGPRPGEKLTEELYREEERMDRTRHPKIFIGGSAEPAITEIDAFLARLLNAAQIGDRQQVIDRLKEMIPDFTPEETPLVEEEESV